LSHYYEEVTDKFKIISNNEQIISLKTYKFEFQKNTFKSLA